MGGFLGILFCLPEMDSSREGGSINRPPVLDGTNYGYSKARMRALMKSLDSKTWKAVIHGWEAPVIVDDKGAMIGPKPEKGLDSYRR